ncbi:hypothetical protein ALP16_00594 [Pseudomonas savastanoi]|uniref:Uncharacterized protein n=2 Tax=Pseudomonas savastanoi TaxID=29438 RepID=A0A3M6ANN0_PSESS|nr:Uncharacterized protein ALO74_02013 [Pseudomonas syringae pv. cunninghamiae]RMV20294.1 hypothetical protein ALP16_00594 [Pseudomonas savastanoi]RMV26174.1 hypothetical protein ALP15_00888 [Pseudomonas savastanoi]
MISGEIMELEPVTQMILIIALAVLGIAVIYLLLCWALIWKSTCPPTRIGEIGWKRVDYIWIIIGSLALLIHFLQVSANIKIAERNMEEAFGRGAIQTLNIAATSLSDSKICLPSTASARKDLAADYVAELDAACERFTKIRPHSRAGTQPDVKVIIYLAQNTTAAKYSNPILSERVKVLYRSWDNYLQQLDSINEARGKVSTYEEIIETSEYFASFLLAFAIALRLAKVTGEIRLKTHSIESSKKTSIASRDGDSHELNYSARQLSLSAQELRLSASNLSNAAGQLKNSSKLAELHNRLANIEKILPYAYWILAGSVCISVAVALLLQRILAEI